MADDTGKKGFQESSEKARAAKPASAARAKKPAARHMAERSTEAAQRLADGGAATARRASEAAAETGTGVAEATRRAAELGRDVARQGAEAAAETSWRVAETVSRQASRAGSAALGAAASLTDVAQGTTRDFSAFARLPVAAASGFQEAGRIWLNWASRTARSGTRLSYDLLRCTSIQDYVLVQSEFMRELLANAMETGGALFRVSSQVSQDTRRPLDEPRGD
jgi:hypothetical protein